MIFTKRDNIRDVLVWGGGHIWVFERDGKYYPCETNFHAILRIVSPSLNFRYSQAELKQAFQTGFLNH